jgi:hypothetical protein
MEHGPVKQIKKRHPKVVHLSQLLSLCLALSGCSLSMPKDDDLFAPDRSDVAHVSDPKSDDGADAGDDDTPGDMASDAGQPEPSDDGNAGFDAGGDVTADAGDMPTEDAGPHVFDPKQGLIAHYRFNESTGNTVHDFASDNDALVVGTPDGYEQWVAAGRVDGALKLAGGAPPETGTGHYVELPQGILLGLQETTISLWLNRSGGPMWQRVFDLGSGQPVWLFFTPYGGTGLPVVAGRTPALIFVDFVPIADAPEGEGVLGINQPIPVSTWTHFALTWTSEQVKVYLNGELVAQTTTHGGVKPGDLGNTGQNYLGRSQFETDPYFEGLLDEFRIYDRALSDSDVAELYQLQ